MRSDSIRCEDFQKVLVVVVVSFASMANAAQIGSGLINWASPIILFLGLAAIVIALVSFMFGNTHALVMAAGCAVVLVIVFFLLRNASAFQSAVQAG